MDSAQNPPSDNGQQSPSPEIAAPPEAPEISSPPAHAEIQPPPTPPEISPPPQPPEIPAVSTSSTVVSTGSLPPDKKFPFMLVTVILILTVAGFGGSFIFFKLTSPKKNTNTVPLVTPPATLPPATPTTVVNPFASPSAAIVNPFATPTTKFENPFGTSTNPFAPATNSANTENQPVKNPFE